MASIATGGLAVRREQAKDRWQRKINADVYVTESNQGSLILFFFPTETFFRRSLYLNSNAEWHPALVG